MERKDSEERSEREKIHEITVGKEEEGKKKGTERRESFAS